MKQFCLHLYNNPAAQIVLSNQNFSSLPAGAMPAPPLRASDLWGGRLPHNPARIQAAA